nr:hypothetical protein [uncultured Actinoplanes sp.]
MRTDTRQRPVLLDTGELGPAVRQHGRTIRAVRNIAVALVIGVGAIAAGGWSVMTAAHGTTPAERPAPLWNPASSPAPEPIP